MMLSIARRPAARDRRGRSQGHRGADRAAARRHDEARRDAPARLSRDRSTRHRRARAPEGRRDRPATCRSSPRSAWPITRTRTSAIFPQADKFTGTWAVGVQATWNLNDALTANVNRDRLAGADRRAARRPGELSRARLGSRSCRRSRTSSSRCTICSTTANGLQSAEESYRVRKELLAAERATAVELVDSETDLTRARIAALNARDRSPSGDRAARPRARRRHSAPLIGFSPDSVGFPYSDVVLSRRRHAGPLGRVRAS